MSAKLRKFKLSLQDEAAAMQCYPSSRESQIKFLLRYEYSQPKIKAVIIVADFQ